jgi:maltose/moltooligosaccharide transporter
MEHDSDVRQKVWYSFGQIGNGAYNGINIAVLTLFVGQFTNNNFIIAYLGNSKTVEGVVIQPIVGRLSDRTASPLGRRRPFILFGVPISVFLLMLVPIFGHTHNYALPLIVGSIILFSIFWNIAQDPYSALMIDITAPDKRSKFNAILSVLALAGQVAIVAFTAIASIKKNHIPDTAFYVCGAIMLLSYVVVFFGVREPKEASVQARVEEKIPLRTYIEEMRQYKEAMKLLVSIFFLWTGLNAILPFISSFPKHIVHATDSQSLLVYVTVIASAGVFAYPFGVWARKYGIRKMIIVGTLLLIASAAMGLVVPSYSWLFPLAVLAGCGFSATTVLTYPYLSFLVPGSKMGVFTGLQTAFSAVAVPLSAAVTAGLIGLFGWRSIFAMLAAMMVIDVYVLTTIDEDAAQKQLKESEERERALVALAQPFPTG